jgi:hypothetical protein
VRQQDGDPEQLIAKPQMPMFGQTASMRMIGDKHESEAPLGRGGTVQPTLSGSTSRLA